MFKNLIRKWTKWAWEHEYNVSEGIAKMKSLHMDGNAMEMEIKLHPEQQQYIAQCFAAMVAESANYTEMKFDMVAKYPRPDNDTEHKWVTVTVQKGMGKTPHQLRQIAENRVTSLQNELQDTQKLLTAAQISSKV